MSPNFADQMTLFHASLVCAFSGGRVKPDEGFKQAKAFMDEARKQLPHLLQPPKS